MEGKLASFRRHKMLNEGVSKLKEKLSFKIPESKPLNSTVTDSEAVPELEEPETSRLLTENSESTTTPTTENSHILKTISKCVLWLIIYIYFIYIEFGAVYFCISLLVFICLNTRTGKSSDEELSAYSVFNKNFERLDGTFDAEQVEKQIRSGMF